MKPRRGRDGGDASFREKLVWGLGGFGENMANNALPALANAIYQIGHGLSPVTLGWVLAGSRVVDAMIDPVVGNLSDNLVSRHGRRRPFVVAGAVLLAVTFAFLWLPPAGLPDAGVAVYLAVAAAACYLSFAIFVIPYSALGLEMATGYESRTRLYVFRLVPAFAASLVVPTLYKLARADFLGGNEVAGMRYIGVGIAALILLTALPAGIFCRERRPMETRRREGLAAALRVTLRNRPFLILLGSVFLTFFGLFCAIIVYSNLNIYFVCRGDKDLAGTVGANVGVAKALGELAMLPVFTLLAMRFQKHQLAAAGLATCAAGYLLSWKFFTPSSPYLQLAAFLPANLGLCACWILNGSMLADICDSDELATGLRREGMFTAVFSVCYKAGIACGSLAGNYLLFWSGARGGRTAGEDFVSLPPEALDHMRLAYFLPPALAFLGAAGCLLRFPLGREEMAGIRAELDARQR